jgi:hypothetical protein
MLADLFPILVLSSSLNNSYTQIMVNRRGQHTDLTFSRRIFGFVEAKKKEAIKENPNSRS